MSRGSSMNSCSGIISRLNGKIPDLLNHDTAFASVADLRYATLNKFRIHFIHSFLKSIFSGSNIPQSRGCIYVCDVCGGREIKTIPLSLA